MVIYLTPSNIIDIITFNDNGQILNFKEEKSDILLKATGIVRKVDELGRIVIPMELRRTFSIDEADPLEIYTDDEKIILKKYEPGCMFCGNVEELKNINGKIICQACLEELKKLTG